MKDYKRITQDKKELMEEMNKRLERPYEVILRHNEDFSELVMVKKEEI